MKIKWIIVFGNHAIGWLILALNMSTNHGFPELSYWLSLIFWISGCVLGFVHEDKFNRISDYFLIKESKK